MLKRLTITMTTLSWTIYILALSSSTQPQPCSNICIIKLRPLYYLVLSCINSIWIQHKQLIILNLRLTFACPSMTDWASIVIPLSSYNMGIVSVMGVVLGVSPAGPWPSPCWRRGRWTWSHWWPTASPWRRPLRPLRPHAKVTGSRSCWSVIKATKRHDDARRDTV